MGNTNEINTEIGTNDLFKRLFATQKDNQTCFDNCTIVDVKCGTFVSLMSKLFKEIGFDTSFSCPLKYFKCSGNVALKDRLISGFYSDQKLTDGTKVPKPSNSMKCSHGGILDATAYENAKGGINKDTGYYLISPRADLHSIAVELAIRHTERFFNKIRERIKDNEFSEFLLLKVDEKTLDPKAICSSSKILLRFSIINLLLLFSSLTNFKFFN
jgi:hypothetical protein